MPIYRKIVADGSAFPVDPCTLSTWEPELLRAMAASRPGEIHIGEVVRALPTGWKTDLYTTLTAQRRDGARYVLLGIPEDVGPQANRGKPGARRAWEVFLRHFLTLQNNSFMEGHSILMLGDVDVEAIRVRADVLAMKWTAQEISDDEYYDGLRNLVSEINEIVSPVIRAVIAAGLDAIVIGGGNNNSYPIIRGAAQALYAIQKTTRPEIAAVLCDPHADFRAMEGWHSGNPFTYALHEGWLAAYAILGLRENSNSQDILDRIRKANRTEPRIFFTTFEDIFLRKKITWESAMKEVLRFIKEVGRPVGLEMDLDSIRNMEVSAFSSVGITELEAGRFVYQAAKTLPTVYAHFSEGAPPDDGHPLADFGKKKIGTTLAYLVSAYIKGREEACAASAPA